jgi:hypothetical protein
MFEMISAVPMPTGSTVVLDVSVSVVIGRSSLAMAHTFHFQPPFAYIPPAQIDWPGATSPSIPLYKQ